MELSEAMVTEASDAASNGSAARHLRMANVAAMLGVVSLFVLLLSNRNVVDHDMYHGMALFRAALEQGSVPNRDLFAYTPTVYPSVHHEWGTGMIWYGVSMSLGAGGVMALKYLLSFAVIGVCIGCAVRRQASWPILCVLAPLGIMLACVGFATIRAQIFTMLFTATLLVMLDHDRAGGRWWVLGWLVVQVIWVNLHAGFVVGLGILGFYWLEQVIRQRRAQWHLIGGGLAMLGLILVNPYGIDYVRYLWHGLTMPRPQISEWRPLWSEPLLLAVYVVSVLLVIYAIYHVGLRQMPGLVIVLLCAYASLRHVRHTSLYAVAWLCYVPAWLSRTPFGDMISEIWTRRSRQMAAIGVILAFVCLGIALSRKPWELRIPTAFSDSKTWLRELVYPVGAVEYLREQRFQGNLMTPFNTSSFVSWQLHPAIKIGLDSRYEAAYQPGVMEEISAFYGAASGWDVTLRKYPTDLVLAPIAAPIVKLMAEQTHWERIYRDDAYAMFARPGLALPATDRAGQVLIGRFP